MVLLTFGPHFALVSWFLAFGNVGLVTWEAVGGESAKLAPLFYLGCVTLQWSFIPLASLIPLLKSHMVGYGIG